MPRNVKRKTVHHLTRPNVLSFIAYCLILFFGATIVANINPEANSEYTKDRAKKNGLMMQWVFIDENGEKHDLDGDFGEGEHASAQDFDYLLPNVTGSIQEETKNSDVQEENSVSGSGDLNQARRYTNGYQALWGDIEDRSLFINAVYTYLVAGKLEALPEGAVRYVVAMYGLDKQAQDEITEYQACKTPWSYEMEHGESVLAYEQRSDAPHVCNIQRRTCFNGKLSGSFTQKSCDETLNGNIKKSDFISKNLSVDQSSLQGDLAAQEAKRKKLQEEGFIQPSEQASNAEADFNLLGHLDPNPDPKTLSITTGQQITEEQAVPLTPHGKKYCESPRGEKVRAGQFVKAYRFRNGFSDIPCQVQIRLCADGELEGTYQYASCQPWDTSYEDFLNGYMNAEQPSPQRLLKMLEQDFTPDPEYGNTLDPVTAEEMASVLRS